MFKVCKKLNAKGTKAYQEFKVKLLNLVNLEDKYLDAIIYSKSPMIFQLEKPAFGCHLGFQLHIFVLFEEIKSLKDYKLNRMQDV